MHLDERVVDLVECARELLAVLAAPVFTTNEAANFPTRERDLVHDRPAVVGMFFDQCDKHFVRQWSGLAELGVGPNRDPLLGHTWIEMDLLRPGRCAFLV